MQDRNAENEDSANNNRPNEENNIPKRYNRVTNEIRQRIIAYHNTGVKPTAIAALLNLPRTTIYSIIKLFVNNSLILLLLRGGDKRTKLSWNRKLLIRNCVDEKTSITLKSLIEKIIS
jgi:hypothetical protein